MPRYAILTHDFPFAHWDFLLEEGESCRTWRLLSAPDSRGAVIAERLPDHRLLYLTYEGPVSGNRGSVSLWDTGTYESITSGANDFSVKLCGRTLKGIVHVTLAGDGSFRWTLTEGDVVAVPDH